MFFIKVKMLHTFEIDQWVRLTLPTFLDCGDELDKFLNSWINFQPFFNYITVRCGGYADLYAIFIKFLHQIFYMGKNFDKVKEHRVIVILPFLDHRIWGLIDVIMFNRILSNLK